MKGQFEGKKVTNDVCIRRNYKIYFTRSMYTLLYTSRVQSVARLLIRVEQTDKNIVTIAWIKLLYDVFSQLDALD